MPGPGQPFSMVTAPEEEGPLGPPPMGAPGQDPNARVDAIRDVAAAARPNPLTADFQDPANILSPSTGKLAERFRTLQEMFGQGVEDVPPLSMAQQIGLTLAAIANPAAAQEALKSRYDERDRRKLERRNLNKELLKHAQQTIEAEENMRMEQARVRISEGNLEVARAQQTLAGLTFESEKPLRVAQTDYYRAKAEEARGRGVGALDPSSFKDIPTPEGTRLKSVQFNSETGKLTYSWEADKPHREQVENYMRWVAQTTGLQISPGKAAEVVNQLNALKAPTMGDLGTVPGEATNRPPAPVEVRGGTTMTSVPSRTSLPPSATNADRRRQQLQLEANRLQQLVDDGRISEEDAVARLTDRWKALGLTGQMVQ